MTGTIFLSYAAEDRPRTRRLVEALESRGWRVWWDRTIPPGKTFDTVIEEALAKASCVVVLWSKTSVSSDWVKTEAAEAKRRGILVPVLIDDVRTPLEFSRIQAARLFDWNGDQTHLEFTELLRAIAGTMDGNAEVPAGEPDDRGKPRTPRLATTRRRIFRTRGLVVRGGLTLVAGALATAYLLVHPQETVVVGVMEIHPRGNVPAWMCEFTRDGLNTVLSKIDNVRVYSKQKIDLVREKRGLSEIEAAEQLGIAKMISGTLAAGDRDVMLEVQVVDIKSGMLEREEHARGTEKQLVDMQNEVAIEVLKGLKVGVSAQKLGEIVAGRTNDQLDSYKLLTESMGFVDDPEKPSGDERKKKRDPAASWAVPWPAAAYAGEAAEDGVRDLLERYRVALEAKDLARIDAVYVSMNDSMREALARYFENTDELKIRFSNFDILVEGDEAVATFTRDDLFRDRRSGHEAHLEVRMSSVVAKQGGTWKIRALKKPA